MCVLPNWQVHIRIFLVLRVRCLNLEPVETSITWKQGRHLCQRAQGSFFLTVNRCRNWYIRVYIFQTHLHAWQSHERTFFISIFNMKDRRHCLNKDLKHTKKILCCSACLNVFILLRYSNLTKKLANFLRLCNITGLPGLTWMKYRFYAVIYVMHTPDVILKRLSCILSRLIISFLYATIFL